jgi:chemotaxis methyl-accepting protein methylase
MRAVQTSGGRYRHVVFAADTAASPRRRPLDLGARPAAPAQPPAAAAATTPRHPHAADNGSDDRLGGGGDAFIAWLFLESGMTARAYRPASLRRRLPACLRALRATSLAEARRLLRRSPRLLPLALDALLLGVTEFFRDAPVFADLERQLARLARGTTRPLRVWSAGCSDGSELYSVAMIMEELGALRRCELLGTDCRDESLARAAAGAFAPDALRGVTAERLARHFEPPGSDRDDPRRTVAAALRDRTVWRRANVLVDPAPGRWDVILCRNLAMYLQPAAAESLWRRLASALRPGGLLVTGKAERPAAAAAGLDVLAPCLFRRPGDA